MTRPDAAPKVTALVETAALYWLLENDPGEVDRIIEEMYPNERRAFAAQLDALRERLGRACDQCETPTPDSKAVSPRTGRDRHLCENCGAPEPETSESRQTV